MTKKIGIIITALLCILILTGCGCEHEWQEATCDAPKTCKECGATEGEKLEHKWLEATCDDPETCSICGRTVGFKLGHDWFGNECTANCTRCGADDPSLPGHDWNNPRCGEIMTCLQCGVEEGDPREHDWIEADCNKAKHCKSCDIKEGVALGHTLDANSDGVTGICTTCNKAVEKYFTADHDLWCWTVYDIAEDGSYTNAVSYLFDSWGSAEFHNYKEIQWFKDGKLLHYDSSELPNGTIPGHTLLKAYYANGRVYYRGGTLASKTAVGTALCNAAKKYISFTDAYYLVIDYTCLELRDSQNNTVGYVNAACDPYGKPVAIIRNAKTDECWVVSCNWWS